MRNIPKVGSKVVVTNSGATYSTYEAMAKKLKLPNWSWGNSPVKDNVYKVIHTFTDKKSGTNYVGLKDTAGNNFIIGLGGIQEEGYEKRHDRLGNLIEEGDTVIYSVGFLELGESKIVSFTPDFLYLTINKVEIAVHYRDVILKP
jgi:hypothetical protein